MLIEDTSSVEFQRWGTMPSLLASKDRAKGWLEDEYPIIKLLSSLVAHPPFGGGVGRFGKLPFSNFL